MQVHIWFSIIFWSQLFPNDSAYVFSKEIVSDI